MQTVDRFGNNLTTGGDIIFVDVTLERASPNASYGPAFLFPEDATVGVPPAVDGLRQRVYRPTTAPRKW